MAAAPSAYGLGAAVLTLAADAASTLSCPEGMLPAGAEQSTRSLLLRTRRVSVAAYGANLAEAAEASVRLIERVVPRRPWDSTGPQFETRPDTLALCGLRWIVARAGRWDAARGTWGGAQAAEHAQLGHALWQIPGLSPAHAVTALPSLLTDYWTALAVELALRQDAAGQASRGALWATKAMHAPVELYEEILTFPPVDVIPIRLLYPSARHPGDLPATAAREALQVAIIARLAEHARAAATRAGITTRLELLTQQGWAGCAAFAAAVAGIRIERAALGDLTDAFEQECISPEFAAYVYFTDLSIGLELLARERTSLRWSLQDWDALVNALSPYVLAGSVPRDAEPMTRAFLRGVS